MQCTYVHMPAHQAGCPCKMYKGLLSSEGGGAPVVLHYQMSRLASLPTDHRPCPDPDPNPDPNPNPDTALALRSPRHQCAAPRPHLQ